MEQEQVMIKPDIQDRLNALRQQMQSERIDYYIIPTGDEHQSEYIGDYFKTREYISGFTGSAGTLLISMDFAGLWTDGRYFVQAQKELEGTTIDLFRMQEQGVPTLIEYLVQHVNVGSVIGFDGNVVSAQFQEELLKELPKKVTLNTKYDLVGRIWTDRPLRRNEPIYLLGDEFTGADVRQKLKCLRTRIMEQDADACFLSALDDIMWLFNLRGNDVAYSPVAEGFAYITITSADLFVFEQALDMPVREHLECIDVTIHPYQQIRAFLECRKEKLILDPSATGCLIYESALKSHEIIHQSNEQMIPKAIKNEKEIELCRKHHLSDAIAVTRFLYWLKHHPDISQETELSVAARLEAFRREQDQYMEPSFETIAAYGSNAAMIHYTADREHNATLQNKGLLLVDSGGQYLGATTDITRTIALGALTQAQKLQYTAVVSGMLRLANARFLYGCTGRNLDILARESLWRMGLDYRHGTGHGVGSFLNVHEGPQAFRWRQSRTLPEAVLEPGMIITDEPGIYIEGSHGIRIENELLCVKKEENEWGLFLGFETLTYVPIDQEAILPEKMDEECKKMLNVYHRKVYEMLCPHLKDNEQKWLISQTREI